MPTLAVDNFNIVCATLGGFISLFGLVSYLLKEKFYLSEALISTFAGLTFSPHALNWIKPLDYASDNAEHLEIITLYFSRLVLGVQLVLAGVQLPSKYLWTEIKSLSMLLGPGMCVMWLSTSLLVWAMVPDFKFIFALAVGSCVTPTDPVLSNGIVKGKFADKNIPDALQKIIIAESGANDGLGYPFLFLALYLIKYTDSAAHGPSQSGGAQEAMGLWFGETWGYTILLSVLYGAAVGWLAKELLHWAEERHYVDRESFLVFAITLALFIVGTMGMLGSDDVLACFIAGNAFTWDDWFRLETMDDSLQPTIDMLLNVTIFAWYGAVCPWHKFVDNSVIPIGRLIPLGILVLLFRRLPIVFAFYYTGTVRQLEDFRRALFTGFFGPIGVSAIFYLYISREFFRRGISEREDSETVMEAIEVVVWFLVICSIVVHGLAIALGKLGFYIPRTISTAVSYERPSRSQSRARSESPNEAQVPEGSQNAARILGRPLRTRLTTSQRGTASESSAKIHWIPASLARVGRQFYNDIKRPRGHAANGTTEKDGGADDTKSIELRPQISRPMDPRPMGHIIHDEPPGAEAQTSDFGEVENNLQRDAHRLEIPPSEYPGSGAITPTNGKAVKSIQFADE